MGVVEDSAGEREPLVQPPAGDVENGGIDEVDAASTSSSRGFTARAVAGVVAGVLLQAKLGDITLQCPKGIFKPKPENRAPNEKFTVLTEGLSKYVDHIFIICTDECDMNIPDEFEDKVYMLNGYELDHCNGIEWMDHWVKASQAHLVAVSLALANDSQMAMVLEQDTMTLPTAGFADGNWQELNQAMDSHEWFMLRMGYRPLTFEYNPAIEECPNECKCADAGSMLCWMESAGCDLRASDAYILHRRGMEYFQGSLASGATIDNGVLQRLPNQMVITPQINFQTKATTDFTSVEHQNDVQAIFMERCKLGLTATQARAAAQATSTLGADGSEDGGDEQTEGKEGEESNGDTSALGRREHHPTYEELARNSEMIDPVSGNLVMVQSALDGLGGVHKLFDAKRRLGVVVRDL